MIITLFDVMWWWYMSIYLVYFRFIWRSYS